MHFVKLWMQFIKDAEHPRFVSIHSPFLDKEMNVSVTCERNSQQQTSVQDSLHHKSLFLEGEKTSSSNCEYNLGMNSSTPLESRIFTNCDHEIVNYDGSPITWRVSAYVVICQGNQVLIAKNRLEKLHDILGGGIELGETIEEALYREAMEEGGAHIKIGKLLHAENDWFFHKKGTFHQTLQLFYEAELVGELQKPTEEEVEWARFVPVSEIGKTYKLPPVVEKVIKESLA